MVYMLNGASSSHVYAPCYRYLGLAQLPSAGAGLERSLNRSGFFLQKLSAVIATVAESEKYDLVFQKDAAPFSVDKLDMTAKVMQELK